ncbi:MAG TPA: acetyltransferase [Bryobacteraceae bacterium]|nr:acetyltransferase [Bryobacteraceae bacterium]
MREHAELVEAVRLQKVIWGFDDVELLPVRLFVVATKVGGQVFGAFDAERMVGFLLAIPGVKPGGRSYLHSHMMGILPDYRDRRIGRMLKLRQREEAMKAGLDLVEWTFDPLEIRNAHFNIQGLGAIVRRYVLNQYGTTTSHLHGGLPTDRCVAEWHLASPRVEALLAGNPPDVSPAERIEVPGDIADIRITDPQRARDIQRRISHDFLENFSRGLAVTGFQRGNGAAAYLFEPWDS